jgi:3-oxoacyl-[acyl-carrier-protein] synthase-3
MTGTRLVAVGHFQPERVVTNSELETMVETSDEWIQRRVGIQERRWAAPEETVDLMAVKAARDTLAKGGMTADEVDLVIVATCSAVDRSPNMAARVAAQLGIPTSPATIDVNTACSGFPHGVALAQHAIAAGASTTALVIGSEKLTDYTDFTDRTTCVLTADGAGAFLLTADPEEHVSPVLWGCVPEMGDAVRIERVDNDKFAQNGRAVYRWTTFELPRIAREVIDKAKIAPEDVAAIVLHQANLRIIEPLASKIGAINARVATDVTVSGNTSAASIPLALSTAIDDGRIKKGDLLLMEAMGGGLTWGACLVRL